jgi:hypothetical protein
MTNDSAAPATRPAYLMIFAIIVFAAVCGASQFWRTDLDPIAVPLSIYLTGPGGAYVRLTYYLMSAALVYFSVGAYRATRSTLRSGLALILLALPGLLLPVVAVTELFRGTSYESAGRLMHGLAAQSTFLMLSFGMPLLSSRWRRDPHLSTSRYLGILLAWLAMAVYGVQLTIHTLPRGLIEKLLIVLMLAWLGWAARQLLRAARPLRKET